MGDTDVEYLHHALSPSMLYPRQRSFTITNRISISKITIRKEVETTKKALLVSVLSGKTRKDIRGLTNCVISVKKITKSKRARTRLQRIITVKLVISGRQHLDGSLKV